MGFPDLSLRRPLLTVQGFDVMWNSISKFVDIHEVNKHITFRNDSGARKELISPYNFLPFYLPEVYKDIDRFIYLDSDIVVKVWYVKNTDSICHFLSLFLLCRTVAMNVWSVVDDV